MANITDVAKKANVSISTVSHVINGTRYVSEETAKKVKDAMEELDYVQNIAAFSLRTKKSRTIGLVIPIIQDETSNIFFMQVVLGVDSVLKEKGYFMILSNTKDDLSREKDEIKNLINRQIDGLIIAPALGDHSFIPELLKDKEYVFVDRKPYGLDNVDCVISDAYEGSFQAVDKMIQIGHRKIGVICDKIGSLLNSDGRFNGYRDALIKNNINVNKDYIRECGSSLNEGYENAKSLIENTDITAIFIVSNIMGMGAIKYFRENDINIPDRISVTIFDDYDWTSIIDPPITAIRQEAYDMGKMSAELLINHLENPNDGGKIYQLPTTLIERNSWRAIQ